MVTRRLAILVRAADSRNVYLRRLAAQKLREFCDKFDISGVLGVQDEELFPSYAIENPQYINALRSIYLDA